MKLWNNERWKLQEKQGLFEKMSNFFCCHLLIEFVGLFITKFLYWLFKNSWPKALVKKWFNIKSKADDFHADENIVYEGDCFILISFVNQFINIFDGLVLYNLLT